MLIQRHLRLHWLVEWNHHCSYMCFLVHSLWLPDYIDVTQTVLVILTMAGLFLDRPRTSREQTKTLICFGHCCIPKASVAGTEYSLTTYCWVSEWINKLLMWYMGRQRLRAMRWLLQGDWRIFPANRIHHPREARAPDSYFCLPPTATS